MSTSSLSGENIKTSGSTRRCDSGQISIRPAVTADELDQLYRFRYRIYVEEMGRKQKYADHRNKRIEDPLDTFATNLIAWDSEVAVVGAVRVNFARDGDLNGYDSFYAMDKCGTAHPITTSTTTRMMVAPIYRRLGLALQLSVAMYDYGLPKGMTHTFIDCNAHLVSFYERMGFIEHLAPREHPEYGMVTIMRLDARNREHLQAAQSPFLACLDRWLLQTAAHLTPATLCRKI